MIWLRKGLVQLFSLTLLSSLILLAASVAGYVNLSKPTKLEGWLKESKIYEHIVPAILNQTKMPNNSANNTASLSDPIISRAAQSAFSPEFIEKNVNTVLNSNYDWLEGKATTPNFTIDLSAAKLNFATLAGNATADHIAKLNVCSTNQLAQLQNSVSPSSLNCRVGGTNPKIQGAAVTKALINNNDFPGKTSITAANISQDQPYYKEYSYAPLLYAFLTILPVITFVIAIASVAAIYYLSIIKRKGLRRIGFIFIEAGILLIITNFITGFLVNQASTNFLNQAVDSELNNPIHDFLNLLMTQIVVIELYFGIIFTVIGIIILVTLFRNRTQIGKYKAADQSMPKMDSTLPLNVPTQQYNSAQAVAQPTDPVVPSRYENLKPVSDNQQPNRTRLIQ
ncbi:MAG: hypothetical protein NVS1B10_08350 [Candidatus Saccharimonadales bacterium]